ncbi:lysin [Staphylococcus phage vB_StaM_PB50]|nr:lysin [Staphylococcus phage vB_StaM_PB50]
MKTKTQALDWVNSRIGRRLDFDGWYGAQCMDLTIGYCNYISGGSFRPWGNAINLKDNTMPAGWKLIKNTPSFLPQPGDIAIWAYAPYDVYGHTGIITSANLNNFYSVDQNWFNAGSNGSPAAKVFHDYTGFWGVIRPAFGSTSTKKATPKKAAPKKKVVKKAATKKAATTATWKRNSAGILWKTEKAKFTCNVSSGIITRKNGPWTGWAQGPFMKKGDTIKYDEIQDFDGHIWVSGNFKGQYVYVPIGKSNGKGQRIGAAWGTFS